MPKGPIIDADNLTAKIGNLLANGPAKSGEICRTLGISQQSFSKLSSKFPTDICIFGRSKKTIYALKRDIPDVGDSFMLHTIDETGKTSQLGKLTAIYPKGFYFEPLNKNELNERFFEDLPYFLDDLRPNGFLGRLIPKTHPELNLPSDIKNFSADDTLKYLTRFGCDLIGNFLLGDTAFKLFLERHLNEPPAIKLEERGAAYPKLAAEILQHGDPGSSAGGEQPKFPTVIGSDSKHVIVKFSPRADGDVGQRRADLLVCEHIALEILRAHGRSTTRSSIVTGQGQTFLEVERFDRVSKLGRKGLISLAAISYEFVGKFADWSIIAKELLAQKRISREDFETIKWRELFGQLIANSDMHLGNLSFFFEFDKPFALAPAYDMLPMLYAPQSEQLVERDFHPPTPSPDDLDIWSDALKAGTAFWSQVCDEPRISDDFKKIARTNLRKVQTLERLNNIL